MSRPQKRRFQNDDEKKEKYNSTISSSIADIIRFSLDDQFRSQCFQLMQVNNTNDFQLAIKDKLDSLVNPSSSTSPTLQKRPSFHDEETTIGLISPPDRDGNISQGSLAKQTHEVETTESLQNTEMPNTLIQKITDTYIDEISKVLKTTNIMVDDKIEKHRTGTSGTVSKTFIETEKIDKGITHQNVIFNEDESTKKINGFWPTEECCIWDSTNIQVREEEAILLQEDINDFDLNENDTDWQ